MTPKNGILTLIQNHIPIDILIRYIEALTKIKAPKRSILHILEFMEELDADEYYDILLDVIEIYSELGEYKKALTICKMVLDSEFIEDKSIIMLKIGILYGNQNKKEKETAAYIKALQMNPNNNKVRFRLSELYESQGKIQEALEILEVAKKKEKVQSIEFEEAHSADFSVKKEDGRSVSPKKSLKKTPQMLDMSKE